MPAVPLEVLPYVRGIQLVLSSYEGYTKGKRREADKLIRDEVKRLESVEMAVASDPMIRQSTLDDINSDSSKRGRSTAGKGGTRVFRGKSVKKF